MLKAWVSRSRRLLHGGGSVFQSRVAGLYPPRRRPRRRSSSSSLNRSITHCPSASSPSSYRVGSGFTAGRWYPTGIDAGGSGPTSRGCRAPTSSVWARRWRILPATACRGYSTSPWMRSVSERQRWRRCSCLSRSTLASHASVSPLAPAPLASACKVGVRERGQSTTFREAWYSRRADLRH